MKKPLGRNPFQSPNKPRRQIVENTFQKQFEKTPKIKTKLSSPSQASHWSVPRKVQKPSQLKNVSSQTPPRPIETGGSFNEVFANLFLVGIRVLGLIQSVIPERLK